MLFTDCAIVLDVMTMSDRSHIPEEFKVLLSAAFLEALKQEEKQILAAVSQTRREFARTFKKRAAEKPDFLKKHSVFGFIQRDRDVAFARDRHSENLECCDGLERLNAEFNSATSMEGSLPSIVTSSQIRQLLGSVTTDPAVQQRLMELTFALARAHEAALYA